MQEFFCYAYLTIDIIKRNIHQQGLIEDKTKTSEILSIFNKQEEEFSDRCENLTSIPRIGTKNCNNFYKADYMTAESIISASD